MSSTQRADLYTHMCDPCKIEESTNALKEVAYEKGEEVFRHLGANEWRFIGRAVTPSR